MISILISIIVILIITLISVFILKPNCPAPVECPICPMPVASKCPACPTATPTICPSVQERLGFNIKPTPNTRPIFKYSQEIIDNVQPLVCKLMQKVWREEGRTRFYSEMKNATSNKTINCSEFEAQFLSELNKVTASAGQRIPIEMSNLPPDVKNTITTIDVLSVMDKMTNTAKNAMRESLPLICKNGNVDVDKILTLMDEILASFCF